MSEAELLELDEQSAGPETEAEQGTESTLTLARANDVLPGLIHLLPVATRPFFPGQAVPLLMDAEHWTATIKAVGKTEHKILGVVLVGSETAEQAAPADFYNIGTACRVHRVHPRTGTSRCWSSACSASASRPGCTTRPLPCPGLLPARARRTAGRAGQRLRHGGDQHHQGAAAAQSPLRGRAAHVPGPLRSGRPLAPGGLRRQPHHLQQGAAPGGAGGRPPAAAHGEGAGAAQQRAGAGPRPAEDPHRRGADAEAAARVLPARAAQGDPEGAGPRQGRPHRRAGQLPRAPREAQAHGAGPEAGRRGDGQDRDAGDRLAGVRRHPQLPGLDHPAALGQALQGQAGPRSAPAGSWTGTTTGSTTSRSASWSSWPSASSRARSRVHHPAGGPARGGQDLHRALHRRCPGTALLPLLGGRHPRRGRDQGPPAHLHRRHAGQVHPGHQGRRHRQPGDHAGRDRQDRRQLPRRPGLRPAGGAGPGAEHRLPGPLPGPALRPVQGAVRLHRQPDSTPSRGRCWTAWR